MAKREFSDKMLQALKPAKPGQRYMIMDTDIWAKGLGVRVTAAGTRTFVLVRRFPGSPNPVRRELGKYGEMSLAEARRTATAWIALIKAGKDPKHEEERAKLQEASKRKNTFAAVAEDFIAEKLPGERQGRHVERDVRRELIKRWAEKPIDEVTDEDVLRLIKEVKKRAPVQARNLLTTTRRLFTWAIDQRVYGIKLNPCDGLKPNKLIGDRPSRDRVLTEDELHALWRATRHGYPYAPLFRLLLLTGLRMNEVAKATWAEFDFKNATWIVPASRMKGKNGKTKAHTVPLTADIRAVLDGLPRFVRGTHLFSNDFGAKAVWVTSRVKAKLDVQMLRTLKALARRRGEDPSKVTLAFRSHDIRRSLRTGLASLRIPRDTAEAVLGHVAGGVISIYDRHDYASEKKAALEAWSAKLHAIIEPAPDNVVPLKVSR